MDRRSFLKTSMLATSGARLADASFRFWVRRRTSPEIPVLQGLIRATSSALRTPALGRFAGSYRPPSARWHVHRLAAEMHQIQKTLNGAWRALGQPQHDGME